MCTCRAYRRTDQPTCGLCRVCVSRVCVCAVCACACVGRSSPPPFCCSLWRTHFPASHISLLRLRISLCLPQAKKHRSSAHHAAAGTPPPSAAAPPPEEAPPASVMSSWPVLLLASALGNVLLMALCCGPGLGGRHRVESVDDDGSEALGAELGASIGGSSRTAGIGSMAARVSLSWQNKGRTRLGLGPAGSGAHLGAHAPVTMRPTRQEEAMEDDSGEEEEDDEDEAEAEDTSSGQSRWRALRMGAGEGGYDGGGDCDGGRGRVSGDGGRGRECGGAGRGEGRAMGKGMAKGDAGKGYVHMKGKGSRGGVAGGRGRGGGGR